MVGYRVCRALTRFLAVGQNGRALRRGVGHDMESVSAFSFWFSHYIWLVLLQFILRVHIMLICMGPYNNNWRGSFTGF